MPGKKASFAGVVRYPSAEGCSVASLVLNKNRLSGRFLLVDFLYHRAKETSPRILVSPLEWAVQEGSSCWTALLILRNRLG